MLDALQTLRESIPEGTFVKKPSKSTFCLIDVSAFSVVLAHRGRKKLVFPQEAEAIRSRQRRWQEPKVPPIQGMMLRAYELMERLNQDNDLTRHALATEIGMNPSYLTRILNLLNLAPEIQRYILELPPGRTKGPITESRLKHIARIPDPRIQLEKFEKVKIRPVRECLVISPVSLHIS